MRCEYEGMRQFFETAIPKGARRVDVGADGASVGWSSIHVIPIVYY